MGVSSSPHGGRPCLGAGFVDVEGADDNHVRGRSEVTLGHRNLLADVLAHHVDVVLELRRDGNHGRAVRDGSLNKLADGVVLVRLQRRVVHVHVSFAYSLNVRRRRSSSLRCYIHAVIHPRGDLHTRGGDLYTVQTIGW